MDAKTLKIRLHEACIAYLESRKQTASLALAQAVEASHDDTKSSAGDKYETTREMMQQDIDRNKKMLLEVGMQEQALNLAVAQSTSTKVQNGNLVFTNQGNFYIAIGAGKISVDGQDFFAISPASPLAQKLLNLSEKEQVEFNGRLYEIIALC